MDGGGFVAIGSSFDLTPEELAAETRRKLAIKHKERRHRVQILRNAQSIDPRRRNLALVTATNDFMKAFSKTAFWASLSVLSWALFSALPMTEAAIFSGTATALQTTIAGVETACVLGSLASAGRGLFCLAETIANGFAIGSVHRRMAKAVKGWIGNRSERRLQKIQAPQATPRVAKTIQKPFTFDFTSEVAAALPTTPPKSGTRRREEPAQGRRLSQLNTKKPGF